MALQEKKLDKRIVRTRRWLSQAFLELLAEKDLQAITVRDITEKAAVNRATFYAHYEDKYALFYAIIDDTFRQKLASKVPVSAEFNLGNLRLLIITMFEYLGQLNATFTATEWEYRPMVESRVQFHLNELIIDWLRRAKPGELKWSATPQITAAVISWAIFGAGIMWSKAEPKYPVDRFADHVLLLIAGGLYGSLVG